MPLAEAGFAFPKIPEDQRRSLLTFHGPTLQVIVGHLDSTGTSATIDKAKATESAHALVDTGAGMSCIDDQLAKKLGLPVIDKQQISGVGGPGLYDVYLAYIDMPTLSYGQYGRFTGVHLVAGGQAHSVLLGRTLLDTMIMIYDGERGSVTIAR